MKYLVLTYCLVLSFSALANAGLSGTSQAPADLKSIHFKINEKIDALLEETRIVEELQSNEAALRQQDRDITKEFEDAEAKVNRLTKADLEDPGSLDEALNKAREAHSVIYKKKRDLASRIKRAREAASQAKPKVQSLKNELKQLRQRYNAALKSAVEREVAPQISSMQVSKTVFGEGRAACGELKVSECKTLAKSNAERDATEKGSVVSVEAVTEIRDLKLTKEEIRSETRGQLSDISEIEFGFVEGGEVYKTKIRAKVTTVLSDRARSQLSKKIKSEIVSNLGGEPNFSVISGATSDIDSDAHLTVSEKEEEQRERERERQEELRRVEREIQAIEREKAEAERLREERRYAEEAQRREEEAQQERIRQARKRDTRVLPAF